MFPLCIEIGEAMKKPIRWMVGYLLGSLPPVLVMASVDFYQWGKVEGQQILYGAEIGQLLR